jgi:hypothetical protein
VSLLDAVPFFHAAEHTIASIDVLCNFGMTTMNSRHRSVLFILSVSVGVLWGCGSKTPDGKPKISLSGKVTHGGKPIPRGRIEFEPDTEKGNTGPLVTVTIRDGEYSAPAAQGPIGGPHKIRIYGFDGQATATDPDGSPLFPVFSNTLDLPPNKLVFYFDVPATQ